MCGFSTGLRGARRARFEWLACKEAANKLQLHSPPSGLKLVPLIGDALEVLRKQACALARDEAA